jgi:hypothetical protein
VFSSLDWPASELVCDDVPPMPLIWPLRPFTEPEEDGIEVIMEKEKVDGQAQVNSRVYREFKILGTKTIGHVCHAKILSNFHSNFHPQT